MARTMHSQDEVEIRQLMTDKETAMRTRDAVALVSRYAPETVLFDLAPPLQHAGPEVLGPTGQQAWFATFDGPIDYEVRDLSVTVGADVAFCHGLERLTATPHGARESFTLWSRVSVGLRRIEGAWRVSHEHTSTPFYMDGSFNAAVDLQPED